VDEEDESALRYEEQIRSLNDLAMTSGNTAEEFDELRKRVPQGSIFKLVYWALMHAPLEIE
jgi:hypothetical protein